MGGGGRELYTPGVIYLLHCKVTHRTYGGTVYCIQYHCGTYIFKGVYYGNVSDALRSTILLGSGSGVFSGSSPCLAPGTPRLVGSTDSIVDRQQHRDEGDERVGQDKKGARIQIRSLASSFF